MTLTEADVRMSRVFAPEQAPSTQAETQIETKAPPG